MLRQTDPYLRERLHDLDDLANRLMRELTGADRGSAHDASSRTTPFSSRAT
jgi:phosphotransferase system enzyme I (PtsP)